MSSEENANMFVAGGRGWLARWRQCVKRGELMAAAEMLDNVRGSEKINYTAEYSYAARGIARLRKGELPKTHEDIWKQVRESIKHKGAIVEKIEGRVAASGALKAGIYMRY